MRNSLVSGACCRVGDNCLGFMRGFKAKVVDEKGDYYERLGDVDANDHIDVKQLELGGRKA